MSQSIRPNKAASLLGGAAVLGATLFSASAVPALAARDPVGIDATSVAGSAAPGQVLRVSTTSNAEQAVGGYSNNGSMSANGQYVAFMSRASNLVDGDDNIYCGDNQDENCGDVFVKDTKTGKTRLVSTAADGRQGNAGSFDPALSADGSFVAFESYATNLVPGDRNVFCGDNHDENCSDVFVKDLTTGKIRLVSTAADGEQANSGSDSSYEPHISANGRYVTFNSSATNLVGDDTNGSYDAFVKDTRTGGIRRVSTDAQGRQATGNSFTEAISADGRYVALGSDAGNLVPDDSNEAMDVFLKDTRTGAIRLASTTGNGEQGNGDSIWHFLSPDGRYVIFISLASNLAGKSVDGDDKDTNGKYDVFVKDLILGRIRHVSTTADGGEATGPTDSFGSGGASISADGRHALFTSDATNLVPDDTNGRLDAFVKDLTTGEIQRVSTGPHDAQGDGDSSGVFISTDGRYVTMESDATNLVPGDTNGVGDVFVRRVH